MASLLIELILKGSIMKDYFYAIAVEDQIIWKKNKKFLKKTWQNA